MYSQKSDIDGEECDEVDIDLSIRRRKEVLLSLTFFLVYLGQAVSRTYSQYVGGNQHLSKFETVRRYALLSTGLTSARGGLCEQERTNVKF